MTYPVWLSISVWLTYPKWLQDELVERSMLVGGAFQIYETKEIAEVQRKNYLERSKSEAIKY